jgi:hypothetical protein
MLILEIAAGILLAVLVLALLWLAYKGIRWAVRKANERTAERKWLNEMGWAARLDREGDAEWLRSTPKKD